MVGRVTLNWPPIRATVNSPASYISRASRGLSQSELGSLPASAAAGACGLDAGGGRPTGTVRRSTRGTTETANLASSL